MAVFRSRPEDFEVEEELLYPPSGDGPRTLLLIEKRCMTTEQVARALARSLGVGARQVGYAGRKDRFAVTRQWFSVPKTDPEHARALVLDNAVVLDAVRDRKRLRAGELLGNRFRLVVREVEGQHLERLSESASRLGRWGFVNRFGRQRFGSDGDNALRGAAVLRGELRLPDRRQARFLVSALQADLFNRVLSRRPSLFMPEKLAGRRSIDLLALGDLALEARTGRLISVDRLPEQQELADRLKISATGPLFGQRVRSPAGAVGRLEDEVLGEWRASDTSKHPGWLRLAGERRALRVRPEGLTVSPAKDGTLIVEFFLPPGAYASVLVEELFEGLPLFEGGG